jgi:hypothetical protein
MNNEENQEIIESTITVTHTINDENDKDFPNLQNENLEIENLNEPKDNQIEEIIE